MGGFLRFGHWSITWSDTVIARNDRLRGGPDFERARSRGKTVTSRLVVVKALPNDLGQNRYGFAAGKRLGNAVQRNRAKRLMREAVRPLLPSLAQGFDVVFIARNAMGSSGSFADVATQIGEALDRAGLREHRDPPEGE